MRYELQMRIRFIFNYAIKYTFFQLLIIVSLLKKYTFTIYI